MDKTELWLALARCEFLDCAEKEILAEKLDNLESLTVLSIDDISMLVGRVIRTRCWKPNTLPELVQHDWVVMRRYGIQFVPIMAAEYPPLLREIHDPPFIVFWRGCLPDPEIPPVAIVGTRTPSGNGVLAAARLGHECAECGIPVVSGLARGIDTFAHRGAVEVGGTSVAVLACGLESVYPRSNIRLAARIIECGGCLIGEYPPGTEPMQYHFPQRNRIISGISRAVIVVEAPEKSGALITADFALEQGRDMYVVRDALRSAHSKGTRMLADDGATVITSAYNFLTLWGYECRTENSIRPVTDDRSSSEKDTSISIRTGKQLAFDFRKEMNLHMDKVH